MGVKMNFNVVWICWSKIKTAVKIGNGADSALSEITHNEECLVLSPLKEMRVHKRARNIGWLRNIHKEITIMACFFCELVGWFFFGSVQFWNGNNEQNTTISCIAQI